MNLTAVILTHNEEANLPACLESLRGVCGETCVVDSGSADRTVLIAREAGARVVTHPFETHAKQWNWALRNLPLRSEWLLCLDADQRLTPELREEILRTLPGLPLEVDGCYLPRKQIFRGRWIRHGGYWPKCLLKLFRRGRGRCDERELVDFRFYVPGKTLRLQAPLIEENLKEREILFWLGKHLRFVDLHAREEFRRRHETSEWAARPSLLGTPDQKTLWLKEHVWYRLPPLTRPFLFFPCRYFLRLGFLDGAAGMLYHFLHGFWYELMISIRLKELERKVASRT